MKIHQIISLLDEIVKEDWEIEFEDSIEKESMRMHLEELSNHPRVQGDAEVLYAFLEYFSDHHGRSGDVRGSYLEEKFQDFRGEGTSEEKVIREYFAESDGDMLQDIAQDDSFGDYFQWGEYAEDQRTDLVIISRGGSYYLFEGE